LATNSIATLSHNFRSHPTILEFPNQRFYHGLLESRADPAVANSMLRTDFLKTPGFQVIFHSILGKDAREARSPSFFNVSEASLVKEYVRMLKQDQRLRLSESLRAFLIQG
jgi:helicase MOV-10